MTKIRYLCVSPDKKAFNYSTLAISTLHIYSSTDSLPHWQGDEFAMKEKSSSETGKGNQKVKTDAQYKIEAIDNHSPYLATVIKLGRANSNTLGYFPKGAFEDHAALRQILVALDSEGGCVGYLLYRYSQEWFTITHLCTDSSCRGKKVAKQLVDHLIPITTSSRGIKLKCRRDYNLQRMWSSFGFIATCDVEAKAKNKKLTVWVLEHNPLPLFSTIIQQQLESKLCAMIAPDIFLDLYTEKNHESIDSEEENILLADWVQTELNLCINDETFNQINRIDNSRERRVSIILQNLLLAYLAIIRD